MAESNDFKIVPTEDALHFQIQVRYSATKDIQGDRRHILASTVVAGCVCHAICFPDMGEGSLRLGVALSASYNETVNKGIKVITNMVLLDKTGSPSSEVDEEDILDCPPTFMGGFKLNIRRDHLEANCVVDDHFVALCYVAIIRDWPPPPKELPDLSLDLANLWDDDDLTDVSFDVDGETFNAHRLVLAARSPVFKAELYGLMAESKMASITIQDMGASTFKSMLHCMYHGSLPSADYDFTTIEVQHLLVAADRYGLEMLKQICEEKLCFGITVDTVCSTLEMAEKHTCPKLKSRCLDFLTDGENFKMVATTDEYIHLAHSFPSLLVEVRERFEKICHELRFFPIKLPTFLKKKFGLVDEM